MPAQGPFWLHDARLVMYMYSSIYSPECFPSLSSASASEQPPQAEAQKICTKEDPPILQALELEHRLHSGIRTT